MTKLAANVELDAQDLKVFANPDLKQEQIDVVTSKIVDRMNELTRSLRSPID